MNFVILALASIVATTTPATPDFRDHLPYDDRIAIEQTFDRSNSIERSKSIECFEDEGVFEFVRTFDGDRTTFANGHPAPDVVVEHVFVCVPYDDVRVP